MTPLSEELRPVRAYHLASFDHAVSAISLRRLKVARFSEVNDPFELAALNVKSREPRKALATFKRRIDGTHGLLCFSKTWKNPVLWSHYASGGRGIALGFDLGPIIGERKVMDVTYQDLKLDWFRDGQPATITEAQEKLLLVTKFEHWKYEDECRALIKLSHAIIDGKFFFVPFGSGLRPREVLLGPLCSSTVVEPIRRLTRDTTPEAEVKVARLGYKLFEVKPAVRFEAEPLSES
jgi:hypothetical protein